ncbi:MAG: type IX secretion system membrane protein PorP/SprF [Algoriphagus sp.]|jgi:type IX secretion system PorP/SprF family membrane protein|nr:type IX secretion system membrane protein PorP/SprF [Algoriphagus sp.]MCE2778157.1 type IX secretion system membrane protein PorP/SprF [Algoriphagus sp.]
MNRKSDLVIFFRAAGFLLLLLASTGVFAQQIPQFTQYLYTGNFFNPALAGKSEGLQFSAIHRSQWQGYTATSGAGTPPTTQLITLQNRVKNKNFGYGLTVVNDQLGATSNLEVSLQGSYHKKIQRTQLSFGGYLGVSNSTLDFEELQFVNPEPSLPLSGTESQLAMDMGAGLMVDRGDFYVGLSGRHLNQASYDFGDGNYANRLQMHNYLLMGYRMRPIGQLRIEPSILLKSLGTHTLSYEVSVIATLQNKVNGGIAYRGEESVSLILGYSLLKDNSLKLGYAFDLVVGGVDAKSPTSHELMLRYAWSDVSKTVTRVIQRTPRFRF